MQRIAARNLQEKCQQRRDGHKLSNKVYQDLPSNQDAVKAQWKLPNQLIINGTLATVNAFEVCLQILCKSICDVGMRPALWNGRPRTTGRNRAIYRPWPRLCRKPSTPDPGLGRH